MKKQILSNKEVKIITEYKSLKGFTEIDIRFIENLIINKLKEKIIPFLKREISREVFPIKKHERGDTDKLGKCYKILERL